ncbi:hypothetical protein HRG_014112 [Hirsutella rhossiliensis]
MSGLRLYDCLLLNGTSGDDGYGNGRDDFNGTRAAASRKTAIPGTAETQDCIFVAGLTDDAALEDVWDQLESQLDEADQARSALEEGGLL